MKVCLTLCLGVALLSLTGANSEPSLATYATDSAKLVKITPHPLKMDTDVAILCIATTYPIQPSIHTDKFFDVYISDPGVPIIKSGKGIYPENTVILKKKYADAAGQKTELYTGMIKRGSGYNPQGGDWEYFVLSGDGKQVMQNGALASCMACHQAYEKTDYVTREYFTEAFLFHPKIKN